MSKYIHKSHNVTVLIFHIVCPAKYRRVVFDPAVDEALRAICLEIEKRYSMLFLEVGADKDHVHFLVQSVPMYPVTKIVKILKSITAREVFARCPQVKRQLWGGEFWSDGYYAATVGKQGNEETISKYVKEQGRETEYKQLHKRPLQLEFGF